MSGVSGAVRSTARSAVGLIGRVVAALQVSLIARARRGAPLVVLDIDNTLADSWPSFLRPHGSQRERLASLDPLPNVKAVAHDAPLAAGGRVAFVSHRNVWEWPVTLAWLGRHGYDAHWWNVVLVPSAAAKVPILRRLARSGPVTVWDDLTFGHEHGEMRRYDEVIDEVTGLGIEYHGWEEIRRLVERERGADQPPPVR